MVNLLRKLYDNRLQFSGEKITCKNSEKKSKESKLSQILKTGSCLSLIASAAKGYESWITYQTLNIFLRPTVMLTKIKVIGDEVGILSEGTFDKSGFIHQYLFGLLDLSKWQPLNNTIIQGVAYGVHTIPKQTPLTLLEVMPMDMFLQLYRGFGSVTDAIGAAIIAFTFYSGYRWLRKRDICLYRFTRNI